METQEIMQNSTTLSVNEVELSGARSLVLYCCKTQLLKDLDLCFMIRKQQNSGEG